MLKLLIEFEFEEARIVEAVGAVESALSDLSSFGKAQIVPSGGPPTTAVPMIRRRPGAVGARRVGKPGPGERLQDYAEAALKRANLTRNELAEVIEANGYRGGLKKNIGASLSSCLSTMKSKGLVTFDPETKKFSLA